MRGHLRRRGEGWELRVYAGRDSSTGRKRYVTRTVRGTKRQAQSALAALVTELERGQVVAGPSGATVSALLEAWSEANADRWSPKTVAETRRFMDRVIGPELGSLPVAKLRTAEIDRFYGRVRRRGLAPASVRRPPPSASTPTSSRPPTGKPPICSAGCSIRLATAIEPSWDADAPAQLGQGSARRRRCGPGVRSSVSPLHLGAARFSP